MTPSSKRLEIAIVIAVIIILGVIWAMNGYEDTWLYITAMVIAVPASWFAFGKSNR